MNKKQNTRGFSTQIRKIYVKEDNTLNRFALFLSGLAIALIALLLVNFKSLLLSSGRANASELTYTESIQEIYDYIDSLNGFTEEQRNALNSIISDYFNNCSTVSEDDLLVVYDLINAKYHTNNSQISEIRSDLESKFTSASSSDYQHYSELLTLVDELTNTVAANKSTEKRDKEDLSQAISDAQAVADESNAKIWDAINVLNERTTDQLGQYEFDFGYQDGCYGYYVDGKSFKRF